MKYAIILGAAAVYLIIVLCTGGGIPCPIHALTGLKCPGCGISRMLVSLVRLDFAAAFRHNPVVLVTGPFLLVALVRSEVAYVLHGRERTGRMSILLWIELALLVVYGILRNILPI